MNEPTTRFETEWEQRQRVERARAWLRGVGDILAKVAALDCGPITWLVTPEGMARIGCSRLELVTHLFREQGWLPWPDGTWTGGKAPW